MTRHVAIYFVASAALFVFGCSESPDIEPVDGRDSKLGPTELGNVPNGGKFAPGAGGDEDEEPDEMESTAPDEVGANPDDPNLPTPAGDLDPIEESGRCGESLFTVDAVGSQALVESRETRFNSNGDVSSITLADGSLDERFTYGSRDRLDKHILTTPDATLVEEFAYNGNGLLTTRTTSDGDGALLAESTWAYDSDGRVTARADRVAVDGALGDPELFIYTYPDDLTRQLARDEDGDGAYTEGTDTLLGVDTFFQNGRRNTSRDLTSAEPDVLSQFLYSPDGKLLGVKPATLEGEDAPGGFAFVFDDDDSLTTIRPWSYEANARVGSKTIRDRALLERFGTGNLDQLQVFGSARETPVAIIKFEGSACDRTLDAWLATTRHALLLTCDGDVPCEKVE